MFPEPVTELYELYEKYLRNCRLCPRECGVDRIAGETGVCRMGEKARVARASLHMWEEPCISGDRGSGTVFFTGCSLGCIYCQNAVIASPQAGTAPDKGMWPEGVAAIPLSTRQLAGLFLRQQERGAANINLVTAAHFAVQVACALQMARAEGLHIPVVYNSSGYEKVETLRLLEGLVDIYLPDMKYLSPELAQVYSHAADYPEYARKALSEMVRQAGAPEFDETGMMKCGVIVRVLLLPGHVKEACRIVDYLHTEFGNRIYISLMSQYTPMPAMKDDPLLGRKVTKREYERLVSHALDIGVENGFFQEGESAKESFIPAFDGEGVLPL